MVKATNLQRIFSQKLSPNLRSNANFPNQNVVCFTPQQLNCLQIQVPPHIPSPHRSEHTPNTKTCFPSSLQFKRPMNCLYTGIKPRCWDRGLRILEDRPFMRILGDCCSSTVWKLYVLPLYSQPLIDRKNLFFRLEWEKKMVCQSQPYKQNVGMNMVSLPFVGNFHWRVVSAPRGDVFFTTPQKRDIRLMAEIRRSPVEVGSLFPIIYEGFLYISGGWPWDFFQLLVL